MLFKQINYHYLRFMALFLLLIIINIRVIFILKFLIAMYSSVN